MWQVNFLKKEHCGGVSLAGRVQTGTLWLCSLLLLGEDVELNPGPNWRNPCSVCCRPVCANQHCIYCEVCLNWNHRSCVNMSLEDYFHWGQIEDCWVCPKCDREAFPFHNVSRLSSSSSKKAMSQPRQRNHNALRYTRHAPHQL